MRWVRRTFLLLCLILTGLIIWAGVYARKQGFTESWRNAIEREFEKRGYYVDIGKITLGAFRGLVAEDVRFFETKERGQALAVIDDVYLDVDLSRILQKEVSVNTIDVDDASLYLPLDPTDPEGGKLRVEDLSGRIVFTESMIEVLAASASVSNVEIEMKGTLRRPANGRGEAEEGKDPTPMSMPQWQLQRVVEELGKFEFLEGRPRMEIEFRGDMDEIATMKASVQISSGRFRRKGQSYEVEELDGRLEFDGLSQVAEFESLRLRDSEGELVLYGLWDLETNLLDFKVDCDSDIASLVSLFWSDRRVGEVVFFTPPEIEMEGQIDLNQWGLDDGIQFPGQVSGQFRAERFVTRGTVFSGASFGFSSAGERIYIRNLRLDHKTGVAFVNLKYDPELGPESVRYQAEIKLDPKVFRPFLNNEKERKILDAWEFGEKSSVFIAAVGRGATWDSSAWENKGVIDLRNYWLNGVFFEELETEFESEEGYIWFRDVQMDREEGSITAEMAEYSAEEKLWNLRGVVSTVDVVEGASAFSPRLGEKLSMYRFEEPPLVRLTGQLDPRSEEQVGDDARATDIEITFSTEKGAQYDFLSKTLQLSKPSGRLSIARSRVHLTSFSAGVLGGAIELEYDAKDLRASSRPYDASLKINRVPLEAITLLYGDRDDVSGKLDAVLNLSGYGSELGRLSGHGAASIEGGQLFALPLLGALTGLIQVSGSGEGVAREAQATFQISEGVFSTNDFVAVSDSMLIRGAGSVSLIDHGVDLEAVVNPKGGLSRTLLTPVSELLTFSCTGTVTEPVWNAKHISKIGKLPSQVITEMTSVPIEGLKLISHGLFGALLPQSAEEDSEEEQAGDQTEQPGNSGLRSIGREIFGEQQSRSGESGESDQGTDQFRESRRLFPKFQTE